MVMPPRRPVLSEEDACSRVSAVYTELDQRPVERSCTLRTECCRFRLTGEVPYLTKGEAVLLARALRAKGVTRLPQPSDGACPLLEASGTCGVYAQRPFGCRTHFCGAAGGPYKRREVVDLIHKLEEVDHALDGCGPQTLPVALREALVHSGNHKAGTVRLRAAPRSRGR